MDSLTHIASGALIGELLVGKKLGRRGMAIGAIAQSLPDIDVVATLWLNPTEDLLAHRGITHSILFVVVVSVVLGFVGHRTHKGHPVSIMRWILFFAIEMSTHLFLDAFNNYGTGWFEPFSSMRITFNTIFVLDPFYSLSLLISLLILLGHPKGHQRRIKVAIVGIAVSSCYLAYGVINKLSVNNDVRNEIARQHIHATRYFTTPTSLNNWLWFVVVEDSSGFHTGYRSVFDHKKQINFEYFPQHAEMIDAQRDDLQKLITFSQGYYTVDNKTDTLVFNDLRFGQIAGWVKPDAPFVFHYYVDLPKENLLLIQRGRFQGWNKESFGKLIERIKGD